MIRTFLPSRPDNYTSAQRRRHYMMVLTTMLTIGPSTGFGGDWHGNVSFLSDYQYRGYTKSRSSPVVQGRLDYQHESGWFAGATVSQVSFDDKPAPDRAHFEARPYLGWSVAVTPEWRADLTAFGYLYDGKVFDQTAHYAEVTGSVTYRNWLTGRVGVAPNAYQQNCDVLNYEAQARHEILDNLQISVGLGFHQAGRLLERDYFYWNAGATWYPTTYLSLDLRYVDAQVDAYKPHDTYYYWEFYPRPLENKWILSASLGF